MTQLQLQKLTQLLVEKIFRNGEFMYSDLNNDVVITFDDGTQANAADIIASLHNLLCEEVTGNRYNYMFHWANKCGSWCEDDVFDELLKEYEKNEH